MNPAGAAGNIGRVPVTFTRADLKRAERMMATLGFGKDLSTFVTYLVLKEMARKAGPKAAPVWNLDPAELAQPKRKRS